MILAVVVFLIYLAPPLISPSNWKRSYQARKHRMAQDFQIYLLMCWDWLTATCTLWTHLISLIQTILMLIGRVLRQLNLREGFTVFLLNISLKVKIATSLNYFSWRLRIILEVMPIRALVRLVLYLLNRYTLHVRSYQKDVGLRRISLRLLLYILT